jgi:phospholipid N-methyltransferase
MRKFYQKDWHNIKFSEIGKLSLSQFPGENFYKKFYSIFDKKYPNLDSLDPKWVLMKRNAAKLICKKCYFNSQHSVLSLGIGLGIIEREILANNNCSLYLHEVTDAGKRYYEDIVDQKNMFFGSFPECISNEIKFDFIILGGIEYVFNQTEFNNILRNAHSRLNKNGKLILLSWSFYQPSFLNEFKLILRASHTKVSIKNRQKSQLWGYMRSIDELRNEIEAAGFLFTDKDTDNSVKPWATLQLIFEKDTEISNNV